MADDVSPNLSREPATVRIAMWSSRHRWPVFAGWFIATIGLFVFSQAIGGIKADDPNGNPNQAQTESAKAYAVFDAGGHEHADRGRHDRRHPPEPQGHRPGVPDLRGRHRDPAQGPDRRPTAARPSRSSTRSRTRPTAPPHGRPRVARRVGRPDRRRGSRATRPRSSGTSCRSATAITAIEADSHGFTVHSVSQTLTSQDITNLINSGLDRTFITIGLTFIILLITFGAFVASIVPLVLAVTALLAAFGILGIFSQLISPASPYATQLVVLIGLAVSVDYSLFMITRFRSERREGRPKLLAIETASSTAGRAVFFSGLAVMISIAGLFLIDVSIFRSMAIGTIGVIFVAVIGSLTFLPATLAILGDRINTGPGPVLRSRPRRGRTGSGRGSCWRSCAIRGATRSCPRAFMLLLASPWIHLRIGVTDFTSFPDEIDGVQAVKLIDAKWPQGGIQDLQVAVTGYDRADDEGRGRGVQDGRASAVPGLSGPVQVFPSHDGDVALVSFTIAGEQNDPAAQAIVRADALDGGARGVRVAAGRPRLRHRQRGAARSTSRRSTSTRSRSCSRFVLGLSFLLLLVVFHSLVIPIKAIALNLLSTAAAFGVMVAVFQDGILGHAFGLAQSSVIESWVPIFVFAILFGLSMDYHVFILTRVKEARDRGLDSRAAVAKGISITSGTITSAATIMVLVFAAFITIPFAFIQELGPRAGRRGPARRDGHPERAAAGDDDPARRLELVAAVVPALAAARHDRGRARGRAPARFGSGCPPPRTPGACSGSGAAGRRRCPAPGAGTPRTR